MNGDWCAHKKAFLRPVTQQPTVLIVDEACSFTEDDFRCCQESLSKSPRDWFEPSLIAEKLTAEPEQLNRYERRRAQFSRIPTPVRSREIRCFACPFKTAG
jgi:hypothetical protein